MKIYASRAMSSNGAGESARELGVESRYVILRSNFRDSTYITDKQFDNLSDAKKFAYALDSHGGGESYVLDTETDAIYLPYMAARADYQFHADWPIVD